MQEKRRKNNYYDFWKSYERQETEVREKKMKRCGKNSLPRDGSKQMIKGY